ncbi:MAG: hypothetical protein HY226_04625 [Candidatus Vogelbacteria bacterium]|nr:hypothetical protein [Candidatus Vogelbacteria bacterium]
MDVYAQIAVKIIKQQESIIGPVAIEQAKRVSGIKIDWNSKTVTISGDEAAAIDKLVNQYKELFGQISVEVCKEAAGSLVNQLPADGLPDTLK